MRGHSNNDTFTYCLHIPIFKQGYLGNCRNWHFPGYILQSIQTIVSPPPSHTPLLLTFVANILHIMPTWVATRLNNKLSIWRTNLEKHTTYENAAPESIAEKEVEEVAATALIMW